MNRPARIIATTTALMLCVTALPAGATDVPLVDGAVGYHGDLDIDLPPRPDETNTSVTATTTDPASACHDGIKTAEFGDVAPASTHARAIDCIAWWGISLGNGDYGYDPGAPVTRAQNASFLARTLDSTVRSIPWELPADLSLPDVADGAAHSGPVRRVVAAGVMRARSDGTFRGSVPLRRDEMAVAIVAAHDHLTGRADIPATTGKTFPDLDGRHDRDAIERAYELGFTSGRADGTFDPSGVVNRAQMAAFLTRLLDRAVSDYNAYTPNAPAWGEMPPGRRPKTYPGEGVGFAFAEKNLDGSPVAWNPCDRLPVYANFAGAQPGARKALERAVGMLANGMGIDIHYAGETDADDTGPNGMPERVENQVTVVWHDYDTWGLIGYGGPVWGWAGMDLRMVGGVVSMNTDWTGPDHEELTLGLMHELGHAVGLDHVDDPAQVMYPTLRWGKKSPVG